MSYHSKLGAALKAYSVYVAANPGKSAGVADALKAHYLDGGLPAPMPILLQAALHLLTQKNFAKAAACLSLDLNLYVGHCESHVLDCVNRGPDFLKADEKSLHDMGIMRGSKKYFLGTRAIALGSVYDMAWRSMTPAFRPIVAEAVQCSVSQKDREISMAVMQYVAVCLMPEDTAKLFQLNKLSCDHGKKHNGNVREAADFIRHTAKQLNILLPESMMEGALVHKSQRPLGLPPLTRVPQTTNIRSAPNPVRQDFARPMAAQELRTQNTQGEQQDGTVMLRAALDRLVRKREITELVADTYYKLRTEEDFTIADAAKSLDKVENRARLAMVDVKVRLAASGLIIDERTLYGQWHEARAIRP